MYRVCHLLFFFSLPCLGEFHWISGFDVHTTFPQGALTANDIARRFHLVQDKAEIARVFSVSAVTENGIKDALTTVMNEAKNGSMIE